jgi:hypothetical protein
MMSELIQRQIDRFLDDAKQASAVKDGEKLDWWGGVKLDHGTLRCLSPCLGVGES